MGHILKVAVELLLTLAAMRLASWGAGWTLDRAAGTGPTWGPAMANAGSLAVFAGLLAWNLLPGEPFDYAALVFGAVVYLVYFIADLKWRPW